jgi:hypothetical protein
MADGWGKEEFEELARSCLGGAMASGTLLPSLQSFFKEAFAHYDDATADGKAYVDDKMAKIPMVFELILRNAPDTPDVRRLRRTIGRAKGEHPQSQNLIDNFHILRDQADKRIEEAKSVLCAVLQCLLDLLFDATQESHKGPAMISILGLFYWLVDELTAAQFLARRGYATQAYTHLRVSLEILDKIELFTKSPELVEIWGSGNEKEIFEKLAPPRVRERLGRDSRDPMYKYFSEQGSHATFTAIQPRLRMKKAPSSEDVGIAITLGGKREPARQISILIYCILVTTQALIKAVPAFGDRLNPEDLTQMIMSTNQQCASFFGRFLDSVDRSK